jgi:Tfp pilus assembly protein PilN
MEPIKAQFSGEGHSKSTEPLPAPPTQSSPFTAKLNRTTAEIPRTNDLSDRRGPITSVFAPEDFDDGKAGDDGDRDQKHTADLAETRQTNPPPGSIKNSNTSVGVGVPADSLNHRNIIVNPNSGSTIKRASKLNLFILAGLLLLGIAGLVIGATSYFKRQAQERTAQEQAQIKIQIENQNQKDGQIGRLRDKIAEINRRLQAADKPSLKEKRDIWYESLKQLSYRLDEISNTPPEQLTKISQDCDLIGKELKKIEDEVNSLQGLIPSSMANREPVKV